MSNVATTTMKRIKADEIQKSIEKYVLQRDFVLPIAAKTSNSDTSSSLTSVTLIHQQGASGVTMGLDEMYLNDLTLIESSMRHYYTFSLAPTLTQDYINQFEKYFFILTVYFLKHFLSLSILFV
jgi:hypothetical protein